MTVASGTLAGEDRQPRLRIAMVAPPYFDVPPRAYGGIESVVADLVDELVARGHEVVLIGAGRQNTAAQRFVSTFELPPAGRLGEALPELLHAARVARVLEDLDVDVVHDHTGAGPLTAAGRFIPTVVTAHGPVDGDAGAYLRALGETVDLVAISDAQRRAAPQLPWLRTVHNALRVDTFPYRADKDDYLLFLGRFAPEKAPHLAIDVARAAGRPIVLAGKRSEPRERAYFDEHVAPRLGPDVELMGVADANTKRVLLSHARGLLFPICWDEPFGMVTIEAMACGTPVITLNRGAAPEVVRDGVTGFVCTSTEEMTTAVDKLDAISPQDCRAHVATRFNVAQMAAGYEQAYLAAIRGRRSPRPAAAPRHAAGAV